MTGQKDRYSTTEKLWKLEDKQLTTPKHDELVLMLLNEDYCKKILNVDKIISIGSEDPITSPNNPFFIIGYWDVVVRSEHNVEYEGKIHTEQLTHYIECKPHVDSFGETLRQIKTYINYLHPLYREEVYLFTPDVRFKSAFESQLIRVISP